MSDSNAVEFADVFSGLFRQYGWRTFISPREFVDRWHQFAEDCESGFPWDVEDYLNDLTMRSTYATVQPLAYKEFGRQATLLGRQVAEIDFSLRDVFTRDISEVFSSTYWWFEYAPGYASQQFCTQLQREYGVQLTPRSLFDDDVRRIVRLLEEGVPPSAICQIVQGEEWYVSSRSSLMFRILKYSFSLDRAQWRVLWQWLNGGEISMQQLSEALDS